MSKKLDFDRAEAEELYKQGMIAKDISKQLNTSYQAVLAHLKKVGLHKPKPKKRTTSTSRTKKKARYKAIGEDKDKIAYCNEKYGEGRWYFMSREQFIAEFTRHQMLRELEKDISE